MCPPPSTVGQGYPGVRIGALRIWFARPVKLWGAPRPGSARIPQPIGSSCVTLIPLADRYFSLPAQSTIMLKAFPLPKKLCITPKIPLLLLFLGFHNTCWNNSPVGLSSHACCAFPGLHHCCRTASRTIGLFSSNIVHRTRLFNLQTP